MNSVVHRRRRAGTCMSFVSPSAFPVRLTSPRLCKSIPFSTCHSTRRAPTSGVVKKCSVHSIQMNTHAHTPSSSDHGPYSSHSSSSSSDSTPLSSTSSSKPTTTTITTKTSKKTRRIALVGVIFLFITYVWAIILIIPMLIAHPFVMFFDGATRRFHDVIAMAWMRCSFGTVRVRPRVINPHNVPSIGTSVVYVANHSSYLDIFLFAYLFRRIKYVSKAEIFRIPIIGWAMAMAGNIALVRASAKGQMQAYRRMVETIKNGLSLVVFPEGTRSANGVMRRFKPGAFRAAKQNNVMVVPITILGTREVMPSSAYVPLRYPRKELNLVVHDPIDTRNLTISQVVDAAFRAIDSALPVHVRTYRSSNSDGNEKNQQHQVEQHTPTTSISTVDVDSKEIDVNTETKSLSVDAHATIDNDDDDSDDDIDDTVEGGNEQQKQQQQPGGASDRGR